MRILALDSSGLVASVAVVEDGHLLAEYTIDYKKTHSQTLVPMMDEIKKMTELDLSQISAIAVANGPGSFTGLRIGAATAQGLSLALNKPMLGISTLEGLAYNLYGSNSLICPIMDARRGQVYTGVFTFIPIVKEGTYYQTYEITKIHDPCAIPIEGIISFLNDKGRSVVFLGDGVSVFEEVIMEQMKVPFSFAPAHQNRQSAASVGALAYTLMQEISGNSPVFQLEYLRMSQAERERLEKEQKISSE